VLSIGHADIDVIDVYVMRADSRPSKIGHTGLEVVSSDRLQRDPEYSFDLHVPQRTSLDVYLKVRSTKQLQVPVWISSASAYSQAKLTRNLMLGGYIGIMLVMVLYNFFIYLSMRDKSYLLYVLYIVSVALTQLAFTGIAPFYFWPDVPWFATKATVILTITTAILASEFIIVFIHTRTNAAKLHRGLRYFYPVFAVCVLLDFLGLPLIAYKATQMVSGLFATYLIAVVIMVWRNGSRQASYFLLAWSGFLVGTVLFVMKDMGFLPYNELTIYTMPVGSAIEGVLLSFGLADRINVLRKEKEQSQAESLRVLQENERIIREQNVVLEHKVKERTHALQESNDNLKRTQTQLVNAEKMASLGQLTAGIAHEINNPINFITSNVQPLRRNIREIVEVMEAYRAIGPADAARQLEAVRSKERAMDLDESIAELDDIIDSIAEGSSRTAEIVRGLRNFSRLDEDDLKEADLNEGLRSTLAVLAPQFRDKVSIELELGAIPPVECFPGKVNQVFMNVITNAVQATLQRPGDRPRVVHVSSIQQDDRVLIRISDNGVGMTDDVKVRIYDPFFTTKPVGEGTGLGMAIVYGIIQDHQGDIRVESSPGVGTEFTIDLPVRHQRANQQRA
jgi:signal transduction histidine kinase